MLLLFLCSASHSTTAFIVQVLQARQAPLTTWSTLLPRWEHLAKHDTHAAVRARALAALATAGQLADQPEVPPFIKSRGFWLILHLGIPHTTYTQQQEQQTAVQPHPPSTSPHRPAAGSSSDASAESWRHPTTPNKPTAALLGQPSITSSGVASSSDSEYAAGANALEKDGQEHYSDDFESFGDSTTRPRTCSIEDKLLRLRLHSARSASEPKTPPAATSANRRQKSSKSNSSSAAVYRVASSPPGTPPTSPPARMARAVAALEAANAAGRRDLDWAKQQGALEQCTALVRDHPDVVAPHVKGLVLATVPAVGALRSQTARHALALLQALLSVFPKAMEAEAEAAVGALLRRAGEGGPGQRESFLCKEADAVLETLCSGAQAAGAAKAAAALLGYANHKHAGVRGRVAVHLVALAGGKGVAAVAPGQVMQARLLAAGVLFAEEGAADTRRAGRALLQMLGQHVGGAWGPLLGGLGEVQQRRASRLLGTLSSSRSATSARVLLTQHRHDC